MKKVSVIGKWTVGSLRQGEEVEHWAEFCGDRQVDCWECVAGGRS